MAPPYLMKGAIMEIKDMSKASKERLQKCPLCPLCGQRIESYDDVQTIKYRTGRYIEYHFFHTKCLQESRKNVGRI